jgi:hypothetical protein
MYSKTLLTLKTDIVSEMWLAAPYSAFETFEKEHLAITAI